MKRRDRRAAERAAYEATGVVFHLNNVQLEKVDTFRYLGRLLSYNNSDWPTLFYNLKKAQQRWGMVSRVLVRDGASTHAMGLFYKAIVQAVLLYGCETWTLTDPMIKALESFHHKVARRISGKMPKLVDGEWHYPPLQEALDDAGLYPIRQYIDRRMNTIRHYIETRPISQLRLIASAAAGNDDKCLCWWTQNVNPKEVDDNNAAP
jgi:hypothetical protein